MHKLRIWVVGYGNKDTTHVYNIFNGKVPTMEVGTVCDISEARREALKERYSGIPVFETAE